MASRLPNGLFNCLLYFLSTNLHNSYAQYYYAPQSDTFNIAVILGSALIALILVVLAFYFLYYCWIKGLLAEYREEQNRIFGQQQQQEDENGGHYYKKRPPPPPQPQVPYGSGAYKQQELGPSRFQVRHSPQRIEDVEDGLAYRPNSAGAQIYRGSPVHDVSYDRSITMRAGSPTQIAASNLAAANEFADSSLESRRRYSPTDQTAANGGGNFRTTTTTTQYGRSNTMPGGNGEQNGNGGGSRPPSGLSARSRGAFEIAGVDYRADAGQERQRASDSGNGGSLSYQATFQQKVKSTSSRNRAAYLGSAV